MLHARALTRRKQTPREAHHRASQNQPKAKRRAGAAGQSDTPPQQLVLASGNPRLLVFVTRGFTALPYMMVRYTPHQPTPAWRLSEPCNWGLDWSQDSGVQGGILAQESPGRGSILTDYSVAEEVYLRMWGEHGKGPWAGQQGGNQWKLNTDSPSQVLGRAQE